MHDISGLTRFSIATSSTNPLRGIVELDVAGATLKFAITEDSALLICTDLERFLTQAQQEEGRYRRRA